MRVYSWKTLLVTVIAGGGFFVYRIFHLEDLTDFIWLITFGWLVVKGLSVSFSKDAYEEDVKRAQRGKRVYRRLFGKFAPFAPYIPLYFLLLGWGVAVFFPTWKWLLILLLPSAAASAIWISVIIRKQMGLEEEREALETGSAEPDIKNS